MKKVLGLLCVTALILLFSACNSNSYAGTYYYEKNNDLSLSLNKDYTFSLSRELDKFDNSDSGKYTIKNNKITLKFDNSIMISKHRTNELNGDVQGSKIFLKDIDSYFSKE